MGGQELEALKAEIEEKFGTVYRFCRSTGLNKSTVYMALNGSYPGNTVRQAKRIRAALDDDSPKDRVRQILEREACARCRKRRTCDHRACARLFDAMTKAVMEEVILN